MITIEIKNDDKLFKKIEIKKVGQVTKDLYQYMINSEYIITHYDSTGIELLTLKALREVIGHEQA